ncbi:hypothetical protein Tco_0885580 [Tanacetum coccineum]
MIVDAVATMESITYQLCISHGVDNCDAIAEAEVGSDSDGELQEVDQENLESEGERDQSSQEVDSGDQRDKRNESEGKDSGSDQIGQRVVTSRRREVVESDSQRSEENQYMDNADEEIDQARSQRHLVWLRAAHEAGAATTIINIGKTRADNFADLKINARLEEICFKTTILIEPPMYLNHDCPAQRVLSSFLHAFVNINHGGVPFGPTQVHVLGLSEGHK